MSLISGFKDPYALNEKYIFYKLFGISTEINEKKDKRFAPINGMHPESDSMQSVRLFPELGRSLTVNDIGKKIIRTTPFLTENGHYDWSYMPTLYPWGEAIGGVILEDLQEGKALFKFFDKIHTIPFDDDNWCTLDELKAAEPNLFVTKA